MKVCLLYEMKVCLLNESFPPVIDGVVNVLMNYANYMMKDYDAEIEVSYVDDIPVEASGKRMAGLV